MIVKTDGTIQLEHVTETCNTDASHRPAVFLVNFDGEWDLWFSKGEPSDLSLCIAELNAYYRKDWAGTDRLIAVKVLKQVDSGNINCM